MNNYQKGKKQERIRKYRCYRLLCLMIVLFIVPLFWGSRASADGNDDDFEFVHTDDGMILVKYYGEAENVVIPDRVDGDPVIGISDFAFQDCSIKNVILPGGLKYINYWAFQNCNQLTSIIFPEKLKTIDKDAFIGCKSLKNIEVVDNNPYYSSYEGCLYDKEFNTLIMCPEGKNQVDIYSGISSIGNYAFHNCDNLEHIILPDNIVVIGDYAFTDCDNLKSIGFCNFAIDGRYKDENHYKIIDIYKQALSGNIEKKELLKYSPKNTFGNYK